MDKEELLAEANRRYPIGTKFICAKGERLRKSTVKNFPSKNESWWWIDKRHIIVDVKEDSDYGYYLYYQGVWAKIISKCNNKIIQIY